MNFRDSEFAQGVLLDAGFGKAESFEDADIILFNTCSVRKHAEDRVCANIWNLKKLKDKKPDILIGVMGCMAQAKREGIFEDMPLVDFTCGPDDEEGLPEIIKGVLKDRLNVASLNNIGATRKELFPEHRNNALKAFVSISHGCDNFCSYCIVPYVRGRERSRLPKDILREIKNLASRGFKEITLLGQNVNSYDGYGGRRDDFARLLADINRIKGVFRVRFMTSHPKDATISLFKAMRDLEKVCGHIHLPAQSGSDRILKLMNRRYSAKEYLKKAASYRRLVPGGSLTTDMIVGFPSESDADFQKTLNLMKEIEFDSAFVFRYSPRPFTKASKLIDDVPEEVKGARNTLLLDAQNRISKKKNMSLCGTTQEVLLESSKQGLVEGRTRSNKVVLAHGRDCSIGEFVRVRIDDATCSTLRGKVSCQFPKSYSL